MAWLPWAGWLVAGCLVLLALCTRRRLEAAARAEHELRGPLAALTLGVEQVRRGGAGAELAGTLEAQLDRTRAGLRDLTAALAGGSVRRASPAGAACPPERARVSLERLARHTAAGFTGIAARGGRSVRFDWQAGQARVAADRGRLAQALGNLLSNAIEHGNGEVELRGRRVGSRVRIEVADRGDAGRLVPAGRRGAVVPRAGERRPYEAAPGRGGGPGLGRGRGLGIATRAVEESGGTLEIVPGRTGTTAALELPLEER